MGRTFIHLAISVLCTALLAAQICLPTCDAHKDLDLQDYEEALETIAPHEDTSDPDPQLLIVRLRPRLRRTKENVEDLAEQWLQAFAINDWLHKVSALDKDKLAIQVLSYRDVPQVKDFVFEQYDAYEIEHDKVTFRRGSDTKPYSELMKQMVGEAKEQRRRKLKHRSIERAKGKQSRGKRLTSGKEEL